MEEDVRIFVVLNEKKSLYLYTTKINVYCALSKRLQLYEKIVTLRKDHN